MFRKIHWYFGGILTKNVEANMEYAALISYEETEEMTPKKRKTLFLDSQSKSIDLNDCHLLYHISCII